MISPKIAPRIDLTDESDEQLKLKSTKSSPPKIELKRSNSSRSSLQRRVSLTPGLEPISFSSLIVETTVVPRTGVTLQFLQRIRETFFD